MTAGRTPRPTNQRCRNHRSRYGPGLPPLDPGGGQACDNGHCSPSWGADVGQSTGGSTGSGGTANQGSGSISGADRNIEEVLERNKQLFLETFSEDNPYCQAPGMASRCATARNQVKAGYDPYSEWVRLICGDINTNCLNQLGYRWNCGLSPCPALLIEGGEILAAVAGGVEAMGGRGLVGGLKSLPGGAALLARLKALAGQGKGAIGDVDAFGYKAANAFCSFSGDTRVLMADGSTKPISEIRPGDKVVATDPETGEQGAREVTRVWVHKDITVRLDVEGGSLTTTEDHPFWNHTDQSWQRADALDPGDQLLAADGTLAVIGPMVNRDRTETVYNLTVAAIHTYYVLAGKHRCWCTIVVVRFKGIRRRVHARREACRRSATGHWREARIRSLVSHSTGTVSPISRPCGIHLCRMFGSRFRVIVRLMKPSPIGRLGSPVRRLGTLGIIIKTRGSCSSSIEPFTQRLGTPVASSSGWML
ncbi:polymorphic toxin-type HINT domain-containing protein [Plantactinospora sp. CA-294935]|uniref:polymorphic toxin-type HINT domain-containing protein n=1 Tax=Plantactinospora sp. CA-294935 TaxID=3240012 RepID=UPI003D8CCE25